MPNAWENQKNEWGLTPRQEKFCRYYMRDKDAKKAAVKAGYKARRAGATGGELLKNPNVKAFIRDHDESGKLKDRRGTVAEIEEVLVFLSDAMRDNAAGMKDRLRSAEILLSHAEKTPKEDDANAALIDISRRIADLTKAYARDVYAQKNGGHLAPDEEAGEDEPEADE